jgi:predicted nuclease of predicted toxin-antitoxin system
MRVLIDECVQAGLADALRRVGFDVAVSSRTHAGAADEEVLELAFAHQRVVVTNDHDFGDLVVRHGRKAIGLVLIRQRALVLGEARDEMASRLAALQDRLAGHVTVIDGDKVRQRRL